MGSTRLEPVIALAGNPNTGKSTLFNALTGLRQHTGNWPGKTVLQTQGSYIYAGRKYNLVDLPGTYSLLANSLEEQVARDFICFGGPDATIVVLDATCLERNLNLALQITEITAKVVVCVNLIDEARRKKLKIDQEKLSCLLGVPVVATAARAGEGLPELLNLVGRVIEGEIRPRPRLVQYEPEIETAVAKLLPQVKAVLGDMVNARWLSLRLLEGDLTLIETIEKLTLNKKHVPCGWC